MPPPESTRTAFLTATRVAVHTASFIVAYWLLEPGVGEFVVTRDRLEGVVVLLVFLAPVPVFIWALFRPRAAAITELGFCLAALFFIAALAGRPTSAAHWRPWPVVLWLGAPVVCSALLLCAYPKPVRR